MRRPTGHAAEEIAADHGKGSAGLMVSVVIRPEKEVAARMLDRVREIAGPMVRALKRVGRILPGKQGAWSSDSINSSGASMRWNAS